MDEADRTDALFHALAHRGRRRILDLVKAMPGCSVGDVCKYFDTSRIAVMKNIGVLEDAGLLITEKSGRVRSLHFNAASIQLIYDRWTTEYSSYWGTQVTDLKFKSEAKKGPKTDA